MQPTILLLDYTHAGLTGKSHPPYQPCIYVHFLPLILRDKYLPRNYGNKKLSDLHPRRLYAGLSANAFIYFNSLVVVL